MKQHKGVVIQCHGIPLVFEIEIGTQFGNISSTAVAKFPEQNIMEETCT